MMQMRSLVSLLAALATVMALTPAAQATFEGENARIAFTSEQDGNPEIYSMTSNGGLQSRLTTNTADDRSPTWNQAGNELAFASDRDGDFEIYRMPAAGSASPTKLTNNTIDDGSPSWAPGSNVLVVVREAAGGDTDLVILAADGSGVTAPLTASSPVSGEVEPNWSPDGLRIAFSAFAPGASQRDIFTINSNGTGLTNLTNTPARDDREPNWAPFNNRIAYSGFQDSNYEIRTMMPDGTGDFNVSNFPGADDRDPAWSPDQSRIAFSSRRRFNNEEIFNIASTGQFPFQVTGNAGPDTEPDWQVAPPPQCNDGVDNDSDTKIDYPEDIGCNSADDDNETNPACSDGLDNDGDTQIDYPDDIGCFDELDNDEANPACGDGIDNDSDGKTDYPADPGCTSTLDGDELDAPPPGFFVRPKSALRVRVPLVPAFNPCTSPNRQHGPPLAFPSCNPPVQSSTAVTVGTEETNGAGDNSVGNVTITADPGVPGPPEDSDALILGSVTDVRCKGATTACGNANGVDGADYTGQVQGSATIRITDRFNAVSAGGGSDGATVVDIPFPIAFGCVNTADNTIGATCTSNTAFNAVVPGGIKDGKRSVIEFGQVIVSDGGPDGNSSTAPNTNFLKQGVFVP